MVHYYLVAGGLRSLVTSRRSLPAALANIAVQLKPNNWRLRDTIRPISSIEAINNEQYT